MCSWVTAGALQVTPCCHTCSHFVHGQDGVRTIQTADSRQNPLTVVLKNIKQECLQCILALFNLHFIKKNNNEASAGRVARHLVWLRCLSRARVRMWSWWNIACLIIIVIIDYFLTAGGPPQWPLDENYFYTFPCHSIAWNIYLFN